MDNDEEEEQEIGVQGTATTADNKEEEKKEAVAGATTEGEGDKPTKPTSDETIKEAEKVMIQNIERFVQRIRMVSQQIIQD